MGVLWLRWCVRVVLVIHVAVAHIVLCLLYVVCCFATTHPQCRVEGNPQNRMQFRVTVAAPDPMLAASLKDMVAAQVMSMA